MIDAGYYNANLNPDFYVERDIERRDSPITQKIINFVKEVFIVIWVFTLATVVGTFYGIALTAPVDAFIKDTPEQAQTRLAASLTIGVLCGVIFTVFYLVIMLRDSRVR